MAIATYGPPMYEIPDVIVLRKYGVVTVIELFPAAKK